MIISEKNIVIVLENKTFLFFFDSCNGNYVGQNAFMITGVKEDTPLSANSVVKAWYNEIQWFDYETNTCEAGKVCGHYTQVNTSIYFS